ncbi:MAG: hypothetical protein MR874_05235 [Coriobacteriaceae bacterium]|nr:hypothetical protein [Coriobacteriaceae bacterium]
MVSASFRPDLQGVRAALSQPGVVKAVGEMAEGIAAQANAAGLARINAKYHRKKAIYGKPYRSYTTKGHKYGVALGIVTTASGLGEEDEAENKTLESFNH